MKDAWRSTYDSWKLRSDRDDAPDDYDAEDDARKCYLVALETKRKRGDRHDWEGRKMDDIVERLRNAVQYTGKSGPVQVLIPLPLCREAAAEIERLRNMLDSAANDLREGKPMNQPNGDFSADLTNMIARYLEAGTTPDEIAAALQEAIEQLEGEPIDDAELAGEDEDKSNDDEML